MNDGRQVWEVVIMSENEYHINDPKEEEKKVRDLISKIEGIKDELSFQMMIKKDDIHIDNIFLIPNSGEGCCVLLPGICCKNPHCSTCNVVCFYPKKSKSFMEMMMTYVQKKELSKLRDTIYGESKKEISDIMNILNEHLFGKESKGE